MTDKAEREARKMHNFSVQYGTGRFAQGARIIGVDWGRDDHTCVIHARQIGKTMQIESMDFTGAEVRIAEMLRRQQQAEDLARAHPTRPWAKRWRKGRRV